MCGSVLGSWKEDILHHQDLLGVKWDIRCRVDQENIDRIFILHSFVHIVRFMLLQGVGGIVSPVTKNSHRKTDLVYHTEGHNGVAVTSHDVGCVVDTHIYLE